jgi:hypothetical protein
MAHVCGVARVSSLLARGRFRAASHSSTRTRRRSSCASRDFFVSTLYAKSESLMMYRYAYFKKLDYFSTECTYSPKVVPLSCSLCLSLWDLICVCGVGRHTAVTLASFSRIWSRSGLRRFSVCCPLIRFYVSMFLITSGRHYLYCGTACV